MKSRSPLSGADAFLLAVERMMLRAGQGQHLGLTVLQLGPGVEVARLRSAVERLEKASSIAVAQLRHGFLRIPVWEWNGSRQACFPVHEHPHGTDVGELCYALLNQVSQLFFCLTPGKASDLATAARELQSQFQALSRGRMERAFSVMTGLFRRMPTSWYLRFVRGNSGGHLTSLFYSHTGPFLPECERIAGAQILNGWHVPSVSAPPGSGIFFSERGGCLTATIAWREPGVSEDEVALMRTTLREDLLGA